MNEDWIKEMQKLAKQFEKLQASFGKDLTKAFKSASAELKSWGKSLNSFYKNSFNQLNSWGKNAVSWMKKIGSSLSASFKSSTELFKKNFSKIADASRSKWAKLGSVTKGLPGGIPSQFIDLDAARALEKQRMELKRLTGAQGYQALAETIANVKKETNGFASESELLTASKDALQYGHSLDFVKQSMDSFQKLSKISGETTSSLFEEAQKFIETGDVGLLKNNAALSAYIDQAKAIGNGDDLNSQTKRRELLSKVLEKNVQIQEEYNRYAYSNVGAQEQLATTISNLTAAFGDLLLPILTPFVKLFATILGYFVNFLDYVKQSVVLTRMFQGILLILVGTFSWWWLAISAIILVIADLYAWITGGESVLGQFFGPFEKFKENAAKWFGAGIDWIKNAFNSLLNFANTYGKYLIMAIFPISILYFYFDQIKKAIIGLVNSITTAFSSINWKDLIPDWVLTAAKSLSSIVGGSSAQTGSGGMLGSLSGARASGGVVSAGKSYLVGERGPELFTPGSSGKIMPNGAGGGSVVVQSVVGTLTVNVSGSNEAGTEIKEAVMRALDELSEDILPAKLGLAIT
ncbi:phage tail tape measure protein [Leptospira johnsonii]|uniref:Uncharacterized protein n=1 Tax=Leptospira johnsonii TaxID=1917820 RepID=A0A2P2D1L3_9LEPT|nr:phage tail tape measure protein [Leptospira johnsonii]GBF38536.1 hypothetical protein LPTSP1_15290 [Leptospira johnsonii]